MPIDDNNNLVHQGPQTMSASTALNDLTPPQYGEHQFDQLYSDIDPSGYMTPAGGGASGRGTPFQSRSRSVSTENLASMDGVASSDFGASVLQSRLSNLDVAGPNRVPRDRSQLSTSGDGTEPASFEIARTGGTSTPQNSLPHGGYFGYSEANMGGHSPSNSAPVSRRVSEEDEVTSGTVTPQHIEYSAESLAKVPSYTTALQSNPRTLVNDGLPTYQSATRTLRMSPPMPQPSN